MSNSIEIENIISLIKELEEKRNSYINYLPKLDALNIVILNLSTKMKTAEECFAHGGYLSSGETLSKGELLKRANSLENNKEDLKIIVDKIRRKISELDREIIRQREVLQMLKSSQEL